MIRAIDARRTALARRLNSRLRQTVMKAVSEAAAKGNTNTLVAIQVTLKQHSSEANGLDVIHWLEAWGYETKLRGPVDSSVTKETIEADPSKLIAMWYYVNWENTRHEV